jgi:hypothetical protein
MPGYYACFFRDPNGIDIEIITAPQLAIRAPPALPVVPDVTVAKPDELSPTYLIDT